MEDNQPTSELDDELDEVLHVWEIPEYDTHERGSSWYVIASIIFTVLVIYAVATKNFTFAILILIFAALIFMQHGREPMILPFAVTKKGISVNNRLFPYDDLESFWIVDEPPLTKHVYFQFKSSVRPPMGIFLGEQDLEEVRQTLNDFLLEDKEKKEEPFTNWLWRALKI